MAENISKIILNGTEYVIKDAATQYHTINGQAITGGTGDIVITGGIINATGGSVGAGGYAAGIGSGTNTCGNITINSGTITAIGGNCSAGIGSADAGTCGNITINGGTIVAKGFSHAAGIGSGMNGTCGNITIGSEVTSVRASCGDTGLSGDAGTSAPDYPVDCDLIGRGYNNATCGTVTIDGVVNATTSSIFTHFNSVVSTSARTNDTWTLTHK